MERIEYESYKSYQVAFWDAADERVRVEQIQATCGSDAIGRWYMRHPPGGGCSFQAIRQQTGACIS